MKKKHNKGKKRHVKLGGDKEGLSVKMYFQIFNTEKPNSVLNSCVFSVFEAHENVVNLHFALDQYHDIVSNLQETMEVTDNTN